jgi:GMP synthase-like glutamine amidotransferase
MKVLILNNQTDRLPELLSLVTGVGCQAVVTEPYNFDQKTNFDCVILSGGTVWYESYDPNKVPWFAQSEHKSPYFDELQFIKTAQIPIIGICLGALLISKSFSAKITPIPRITGIKSVKMSDGTVKRVFGNHSLAIASLPDEFEILATSATGVEAFRHRSRRLAGLQFHPEVLDGDNNGREIFAQALHGLLDSTPQAQSALNA